MCCKLQGATQTQQVIPATIARVKKGNDLLWGNLKPNRVPVSALAVHRVPKVTLLASLSVLVRVGKESDRPVKVRHVNHLAIGQKVLETRLSILIYANDVQSVRHVVVVVPVRVPHVETLGRQVREALYHCHAPRPLPSALIAKLLHGRVIPPAKPLCKF